MSNTAKNAMTDSTPAMNWPFGFQGSDFMQTFGGYTQSAAKRMMDLNGEIARFLSDRISRNGQMFQAIVQCDSLPKVVEVETAWMRTAVEDYLNETKRLLDLNSEIVTGFVKPAQQATDAPTKLNDRGNRAA
jgi:hypothetical protein